MFDPDVLIVNFLQNEAEFFSRNESKLQSQYGDQIVNLNSNKFPKGLVTLEGIFNFDDQARGKGSNLTGKRDDDMLVTIVDRWTLNLGKVYNDAEQEVFINLCQEFSDFIA